ncbi:hypothetical protein N1851_006992 [Merluccius polli]|uniref:CCHC-type domain-containing protein n=1 Tax=Merluccius polli TaxID=89951 RepID=A0AA47N3M0_MERPO|nr:hypothetical protein N1851_006992 [Merluccius polli]
MAAQLSALTELVQQLQADNSRLREEATKMATPTTDSAGPSSNVTDQSPTPNSPSQPRQPASMVNVASHTLIPTGGVERYVYVPSERKCPRFSGKLSNDSLTAEDWVEEARRHLSSRPRSRSEQALIVFDLLEGEARAEIKFRPVAERDEPDKIFSILLSIYGCSQSYISLQKQFFQRRQLEGESLREFSHALLHLLEAVKRRDPACLANPEAVLRDQFVENVRDGMLKRELRRQVRLHPTLTFLDVRSEAIRWVEEGEHPSGPRPRAHSLSTHAIQDAGAASSAVLVQPTNELAEVKQSLRKQQAQLDSILRRLDTPSFSGPPPSRALTRGPRYQFNAEGKPICLRCSQPGHIARYCPASSISPQVVAGSQSVTQQPEKN